MSTDRMSMLKTLLAENPHDSFLLFALAKEHEKAAQLPEALEQYLALRQSDPEYVGLYYHLGKLYERLTQPAEAFRTYTQGMAVASRLLDQHAYSELAGARLALGDEDDFE